MKDLLIWVLVIAVGVLWYDDTSKRSSLDQAQAQVDSLTAEVTQIKSHPPAPASSPKTDWFQQRLSERPTELDHQ
jgi:hypothetical protein